LMWLLKLVRITEMMNDYFNELVVEFIINDWVTGWIYMLLNDYYWVTEWLFYWMTLVLANYFNELLVEFIT
jgi:hypothetical protein